MATILEYSFTRNQCVEAAAWIAEQLQQVFDFVNVVEDEGVIDLYYTQNYYIRITSSSVSPTSFSIKVCGTTEDFEDCVLFTNATANIRQYIRIVKSATGDIALYVTSSSTLIAGIPNNSYLVFVITKCRNIINNEENWGLYVPTSQGLYQTYYTKLFVTEGTINIDNDHINRVYTSGNSANSSVTMGYNPLALMTVLIPIYAVSSAYISENTFIMHITPSMYNGDTVINGKHYYCAGLLAMLDE